MHGILADIGVTVIAAAILGVASHLLRQPLLLALVAAGVVIGPELGLGLIHGGESIEIISELGLILLLFIVGLEISLKDLKRSGRELVVTGVGQLPICVALGYLFFWLLSGLKLIELSSTLEILYLGVMCAISSTAIVVKLLYDKKDLATLPGKLTLGVLVFQDIYAILFLALQPSLTSPSIGPIVIALASSIALVASAFLISRFLLSRLFQLISLSPEIVISLALGWCAVCTLSASLLGLSKEMGALIAGVSIAAFPYSTHVAGRVLPLRDFFLTLFFVSLGMKIGAPTVAMIAPVVAIALLVVISRFLSIYPLALSSGTGSRIAFLTSLNLSQMSEFSLVIAALGVASGHISEFLMTLTVYSMVLLSILSSHAIRRSEELYRIFRRLTGNLQEIPVSSVDEHGAELVILGYHRSSRAFINKVGELRPELLKKVVVIDFNPQRIKELREEGIKAIFGDIGNYEVLRHAGLDSARIIVSIIPDMLLRGTDNLTIVRLVRALAPGAVIVATADDEQHERDLTHEGAQIVLRPFDLAGEHMLTKLSQLNPGRNVTETLARRWSAEELKILNTKT